MKVIISTGLGRLHLIQSVQALAKEGVDVEVIQGWVPHRLPDPVINLVGYLVGAKYLSFGMKKRQILFLDQSKSHSTAWPEFITQGLFILNKLGFIKRGKAARLGWATFGMSSKQFIKNQDVFHVRSGAGRGGAIKLAKEKGIKVVADHSMVHPAFLEKTLRDEYAQFNLPFWLSSKDIFWKSVIQDCKDADKVLVNSHFPKDTLIEQGFLADQIAVVYLGVREDFFSLKKDYSIRNSINLLFTGSFRILKGAHYLLAALELLDTDFKMTIVGSFDEARSIIAKSCIESKLDCTGHIPQDELKTHLSNADIYVFPSLAEGCASSGMEAMAAGLPVIATYESGLPIEHGKNGWIIPTKSPDAIAEAISILSSDEELREKLGQNAAKTIAQNYTWSHYAKNLLSVYSSLLSKDKEFVN